VPKEKRKQLNHEITKVTKKTDKYQSNIRQKSPDFHKKTTTENTEGTEIILTAEIAENAEKLTTGKHR